MTKIKKNELNDNELNDNEVIQYEQRRILANHLNRINDEDANNFTDMILFDHKESESYYYTQMFEYIQNNSYLRTIVKDMIHERVNLSSFHKIEERIDAIVKKRNEMKESA